MQPFEYQPRSHRATPCEYISFFPPPCECICFIIMNVFVSPCEYICVFAAGIPASLSHIPGSQPAVILPICGHVRICRLFATAQDMPDYINCRHLNASRTVHLNKYHVTIPMMITRGTRQHGLFFGRQKDI